MIAETNIWDEDDAGDSENEECDGLPYDFDDDSSDDENYWLITIIAQWYYYLSSLSYLTIWCNIICIMAVTMCCEIK